MSLSALNDRELLARLESLCRREREVTLDVLRHLNEVERRKLYLRLGYSSMFVYCTHALRYSESAAGRRIAAARCMRRVPCVEALLERREVSLMSLGLIERVLTPENAPELLERIRGKSKLEVERVVAQYRPEVAVRDRVRPIQVPAPAPMPLNGTTPLATRTHVTTRAAATVAATTPAANPVAATMSAAAPVAATTPAARPLAATSALFSSPPLLVNEVANSHGGSEKIPDVPARTVAMLRLSFAVTPEFMAMYREVCALLSNTIAQPAFATVFQTLMEDYRKRRCPRARHARREERKAMKAAAPTAAACDERGRISRTARPTTKIVPLDARMG
jgi:hypothetical protein